MSTHSEPSFNIQRFCQSLAQLNQIMNRGVEIGVLLDTIAREAAQLLGAETTSIMLVDDEGERLLCSAAHGLTAAERESLEFHRGQGIAGEVLLTAQSVLLDDALEDQRFLRIPGQVRRIRSMLTIPLLVRGRPIGVISATHPEARWFSREHEELLAFLAHSVVLDLENARLYRMAITDALTGLKNRQHFAERLREEVDRAHRYSNELAVVMIDVDHFKRINDERGHQAGDHALELLAKRLLEVTREVDLVARYGGEEFVVLLPNTDETGARHAARRLMDAANRAPFDLPPSPVPLTISIGGAALRAREEPGQLLARADNALYRAKHAGRNQAVFAA